MITLLRIALNVGEIGAGVRVPQEMGKEGFFVLGVLKDILNLTARVADIQLKATI
jgi:hypothetical protein